MSRQSEDSLWKEEEPNSNIIGRPTWWFNGSSFIPKTNQDQRLAALQYQTLVHANPVLSERAQRVRRCISTLSQWFPVSILDDIGKDIILNVTIRLNNRKLLIHFLGALEASLRKRYLTIRWAVLQEINQVTGFHLDKKDIYKWMYYTYQRKKECSPNSLRVVQHLTIEAIIQEKLPAADKQQLCLQVAQIIKYLRNKRFMCKDPEITSWALRRILLEEKKPQTNTPKEFRVATTRMTFRLRQIMKN